MPADVRISTRATGTPDLVIWFVDRRRDLETKVRSMGRLMGSGLWIAWPKKASGVATDVTEDIVRASGLANGLVDYKVCAINETWSGLKFARKQDAKPATYRSGAERRERGWGPASNKGMKT